MPTRSGRNREETERRLKVCYWLHADVTGRPSKCRLYPWKRE